MKIKENYKYSMIIPTSMGVRITPVDRQPVHVSNMYFMQSTSAESNVGNISASLGMRVKILTSLGYLARKCQSQKVRGNNEKS